MVSLPLLNNLSRVNAASDRSKIIAEAEASTSGVMTKRLPQRCARESRPQRALDHYCRHHLHTFLVHIYVAIHYENEITKIALISEEFRAILCYGDFREFVLLSVRYVRAYVA